MSWRSIHSLQQEIIQQLAHLSTLGKKPVASFVVACFSAQGILLHSTLPVQWSHGNKVTDCNTRTDCFYKNLHVSGENQPSFCFYLITLTAANIVKAFTHSWTSMHNFHLIMVASTLHLVSFWRITCMLKFDHMVSNSIPKLYIHNLISILHDFSWSK